jgi:hypothetical protein
MDAFAMTEIVDQHRQNGELYHEFLRKERLSVGLYVLEAGATIPKHGILKMRFTTSSREQASSKLMGRTGQLALGLLFTWTPTLPIASTPSLKTSA